jgi:hypothetical protein
MESQARYTCQRLKEALEDKSLIRNPAELIKRICKELEGSPDYTPEMEKMQDNTFAVSKEAYSKNGNYTLRENGIDYNICHCLRVALLIAILTRDPLLTIHAATHDVGEDHKITPEDLENLIGPGAGLRLADLTRLRNISYAAQILSPAAAESRLLPAEIERFLKSETRKAYSEALYDCGDMGVIYIKLMDGLANDTDLEGCDDEKVKSITWKVLEAVRVAKKLSKELFDLIYYYVKLNSLGHYAEEIAELGEPSARQLDWQRFGWMNAPSREKPRYHFMQAIPDAPAQKLEEIDPKNPCETLPVIAFCGTELFLGRKDAEHRRRVPGTQALIPVCCSFTRRQVLDILNEQYGAINEEYMGLLGLNKNIAERWERGESHLTSLMRPYYVAKIIYDWQQIREMEIPAANRDALMERFGVRKVDWNESDAALKEAIIMEIKSRLNLIADSLPHIIFPTIY